MFFHLIHTRTLILNKAHRMDPRDWAQVCENGRPHSHQQDANLSFKVAANHYRLQCPPIGLQEREKMSVNVTKVASKTGRELTQPFREIVIKAKSIQRDLIKCPSKLKHFGTWETNINSSKNPTEFLRSLDISHLNPRLEYKNVFWFVWRNIVSCKIPALFTRSPFQNSAQSYVN